MILRILFLLKYGNAFQLAYKHTAAALMNRVGLIIDIGMSVRIFPFFPFTLIRRAQFMLDHHMLIEHKGFLFSVFVVCQKVNDKVKRPHARTGWLDVIFFRKC